MATFQPPHFLDTLGLDELPEDRLGRTQFASILSQWISNAPSDVCTVLSLEGEWGSGKTWVLRKIAEQVSLQEEFIVVNFSPWMFPTQDALLRAFFAELGGHLEGVRSSTTALAAELGKYVKILSPIRFVPGGELFGMAAHALAQVASEAAHHQFEFQDVQKQKRTVAEALQKSQKRILVTIDDIDRMLDTEVVEVFRLIRHIADFPGLIYVVAFDRPNVCAALSKRFSDGDKYLEKIIQISCRLPLPSHSALDDMLRNALDSVISNISFKPNGPSERFYEAYTLVIRPLINSPRDVLRYVSAIPITIELLGNEVALGDTLALEAIRLFLPSLHERMASMADELTRFQIPGSSAQNSQPSAILKELQSASPYSISFIDSTCRVLFPAPYTTSHDHLRDKWELERRVALKRVFETYLVCTIGRDAVETNRVLELSAAIDEPQRFERLLRERQSEGTLDDCIRRLRFHISKRDSNTNDSLIAYAVLSIYDGLGIKSGAPPRSAWRQLMTNLISTHSQIEELIKIAPSLSSAHHLVEAIRQTEHDFDFALGHAALVASLEQLLLQSLLSKTPQDFLIERNIADCLRFAIKHGAETALWREKLLDSPGAIDCIISAYTRELPTVYEIGSLDMEDLKWWYELKMLVSHERIREYTESKRSNRTLTVESLITALHHDELARDTVRQASFSSDDTQRTFGDVLTTRTPTIAAYVAYLKDVEISAIPSSIVGLGTALVESSVPEAAHIYIASCLASLTRKWGVRIAIDNTTDNVTAGWRLNWLSFLVVYSSDEFDVNENVLLREAMAQSVSKQEERAPSLLFNQSFGVVAKACVKESISIKGIRDLLFSGDYPTRLRLLNRFMCLSEDRQSVRFDLTLAESLFARDDIDLSLQQIRTSGLSSQVVAIWQAYRASIALTA